jgi:hypothetical protein
MDGKERGIVRLTNDCAENLELAASIHSKTDILAALGLAFVAAAQPVCCAVGVLATPGGNLAELVDSEILVPGVFRVVWRARIKACDHWNGGG